MSAPTALDAAALAAGIARTGVAGDRAPLAFLADRRAQDPLSRLSREHDDVLRQAVDPDEIAASLESAGVNDRRARIEFGAANTFDLAEMLWRRAPWRPTPAPAPIDRWGLPLWRALIRGALYILPALLAALALGGDGVSPTHAFVLLGWTAGAICAGQSVSVLAHLLLSNHLTRALAHLAWLSLGAGAALMLVSIGATALLGGDPRVIGVVAGQLVFLIAATLLIVLGLDLLLLALITPGLLIVAAVLAGHRLAGASADAIYLGAAAGTMLLCVAAASVLAGGLTGRVLTGGPLTSSLGRPELRLAGLSGAYGLGIALLTAGGLLAVTLGRQDIPMSTAVIATIPLTATLGVAEFLLHRCRSRCQQSMAQSLGLPSFRALAAGELRAMVGRHLIVTAGLAGLILMFVVPGAGPGLIVFTLTYAVLGAALLLCTTLVSLGDVAAAALLALGAGAALLAVSVQPWLGAIAVGGLQLAVVAALAAAAFWVAFPRFLLTSTHR